jgi:hypothetical protein
MRFIIVCISLYTQISVLNFEPGYSADHCTVHIFRYLEWFYY